MRVLRALGRFSSGIKIRYLLLTDIEDTTMQTNSTTVPDYVNKFNFYDDP